MVPCSWRMKTRVARQRFLLLTFSSPSIVLVNVHLSPSSSGTNKMAINDLSELAATSGAETRLILGDFNRSKVNPHVVSTTCELAAVYACINELATCITRLPNSTVKESVLDFILCSSPPAFPAAVHDVADECGWRLGARGGHIHHLLLDVISINQAPPATKLAPIATRFRAASAKQRKLFSKHVSVCLSAVEPASTASALEQQILTAIAAQADILLPPITTSARTGVILRNCTAEQTVAAAQTYYESLYAEQKLPETKLPPLAPERAAKVRANVLFHPVSEDETMSALKTRKRRMGADFQSGLNTPVLRFLAHHDQFRRFLTRFVQFSLRDGLTDSASTAGTILIPKVADHVPTEVLEARPIAIGPALAKVPKTILARRLQNAISAAIAPNQHGFLSGKSAPQCVQKLLSHLAERDDYVGLFLDVSKAYDTLSHDTVLAALERFGLGSKFHDLIRNYLAAARTRFHADAATSEWVHLRRGVLQGCPLSCLLTFSQPTMCSPPPAPLTISALRTIYLLWAATLTCPQR